MELDQREANLIQNFRCMSEADKLMYEGLGRRRALAKAESQPVLFLVTTPNPTGIEALRRLPG